MSSAKASRSVTVVNPQGLHLRPAGSFAKLALQFQASIEVVRDFNRVDGTSPMMLVSLGAAKGVKLTIEAEGNDAQEAVDALADLLESFDEETGSDKTVNDNALVQSGGVKVNDKEKDDSSANGAEANEGVFRSTD